MDSLLLFYTLRVKNLQIFFILPTVNRLDLSCLNFKGIFKLIEALLSSCCTQVENEIADILANNTTLLKLGYHFNLQGPRGLVADRLTRNNDLKRRSRVDSSSVVTKTEHRSKKHWHVNGIAETEDSSVSVLFKNDEMF